MKKKFSVELFCEIEYEIEAENEDEAIEQAVERWKSIFPTQWSDLRKKKAEKILPAAFETIFRLFAEDSDTGRLFNGYRLFAVDGSDLQIPTNPQEKDSFFPGSDGQHPYNLLHLNAMYDLLQRTYVDAIVQKKASL